MGLFDRKKKQGEVKAVTTSVAPVNTSNSQVTTQENAAISISVEQKAAEKIARAEKNEAKQMQLFTKVIFWLAFVSFLSMSIPHVAWVYHTYEGGETQAIDLWIINFDLWWAISYGTAISIDVLIAWLSFMQVMGKSKSDGFATWVFIGALVSLSWYCNYLYDMAHNPVKITDIWGIQLLWGFTTTGYITPIIVSAVPVFVIGYTFMLSKIGASSRLTVEELEAQAADIEERNKHLARIKAAKRQAFAGNIQGLVSVVKDVTANVSAHVPQQQDVHVTTVPQQQETLTIPATAQSNNTDAIAIPIETTPAQTITAVPPATNKQETAASFLQQQKRSDTSSLNMQQEVNAFNNVDKLALTLETLQHDPNITDEALADILALKRPTSARFWRLKAIEMIGGMQQSRTVPSTVQATASAALPEQIAEHHTPIPPIDAIQEAVFSLPEYSVEKNTEPHITALPVKPTEPVTSTNGHVKSVYVPASRRKKE